MKRINVIDKFQTNVTTSRRRLSPNGSINICSKWVLPFIFLVKRVIRKAKTLNEIQEPNFRRLSSKHGSLPLRHLAYGYICCLCCSHAQSLPVLPFSHFIQIYTVLFAFPSRQNGEHISVFLFCSSSSSYFSFPRVIFLLHRWPLSSPVSKLGLGLKMTEEGPFLKSLRLATPSYCH